MDYGRVLVKEDKTMMGRRNIYDDDQTNNAVTLPSVTFLTPPIKTELTQAGYENQLIELRKSILN